MNHAQCHVISEVNQGIQILLPQVIKTLTLLTWSNNETPLFKFQRIYGMSQINVPQTLV